MVKVLAAALVMLALAGCGSQPAAPSASPTPAYMLAAINADDPDHPDTRTSRSDAEIEFRAILRCAVRAYGTAETEYSAAGAIYQGWAASGKRTTLLEWAQVLC